MCQFGQTVNPASSLEGRRETLGSLFSTWYHCCVSYCGWIRNLYKFLLYPISCTGRMHGVMGVSVKSSHHHIASIHLTTNWFNRFQLKQHTSTRVSYFTKYTCHKEYEFMGTKLPSFLSNLLISGHQSRIRNSP